MRLRQIRVCSQLVLLACVGLRAPAEALEWRRHESAGDLRFEYPTLLTLSQTGGRVSLRHVLSARHVDPCVMRDDVDPWRDDLPDFDVTLELVELGLREAVATEGGLIAEEFVEPDRVRWSPGFIDPWSFGPLSGHRIQESVEGCGHTRFYLRLSPRRTLRVTRRTVPEFMPTVSGYEAYRATPGAIAPDEADRIFERIVSSVRLAGPRRP